MTRGSHAATSCRGTLAHTQVNLNTGHRAVSIGIETWAHTGNCAFSIVITNTHTGSRAVSIVIDTYTVYSAASVVMDMPAHTLVTVLLLFLETSLHTHPT